ncbi:MAG: hypothetical protein AB1631_22830 [Acidobacteriota bacterium]
MSNKDQIEDKPAEGAIKVKPEDMITDDLDAKPAEGQVQQSAGEAPVKADKVTG